MNNIKMTDNTSNLHDFSGEFSVKLVEIFEIIFDMMSKTDYFDENNLQLKSKEKELIVLSELSNSVVNDIDQVIIELIPRIHKLPAAQRLSILSFITNTTVFGTMKSFDSTLLNFRKQVLEATGNFPKQRKDYTSYKTMIPQRLDSLRLQWVIGMVLGDSYVQINSKKTAARLKTQQSSNHLELLNEIQTILLLWTNNVSRIKTRKNMFEIDTITHSAFLEIWELFYDTENQVKTVRKNIKNYLTPLCLGSWFCSDGGKRDYGINQGKAIQFHTQGFQKSEVEILIDSLRKLYGWNVSLVLDYVNKNKREMYLIQIEASSFEDFYYRIGPYILKSFRDRLPSLRSIRSRYGPNF